MNQQFGSPNQKHEQATDAASDAILDQALRNFRSNVHAWSEAEFGTHRNVSAVRHTRWSMIAGWALGCVLAAVSVFGGLYERHHQQERARVAAASEAARQQKLVDQQRALTENDDLFAKVSSDVSRQVPSAMEPLAQLMDADEAQ